MRVESTVIYNNIINSKNLVFIFYSEINELKLD